ncbi:MAG: hypothetical protein RL153_2172 [Verrucomicrobiota bacterium]|jgi:ribonuclease P protein component
MAPDPASGQPGPIGRGLPKTSRLVHRRDFLRVREHGRRLTSGTVVLNWLELQDGPEGGTVPLLGVITTKALGGAVIRNRARRRMREAFRALRPALARPAWVVLIARQSMRDADATRVSADIAGGLRRARLLPA